MKKIILLYSGILFVLCLSFFPFKKAYEEWVDYSESVQRANTALITFQELSNQVNNAAVINPDLLSAEKSNDEIILFHADSTSIRQTLAKLNSTVRDPVNIEIVIKLDSILSLELSWIIKSSVPDSIRYHKAAVHLASLKQIDELIQQGKEQTKYVLKAGTNELNTAFKKEVTWIVVFILIALSILLFTTINAFRQHSKRKEKEKELEKKEIQFHQVLDNMLEGVQIHDFNWKYTYVNNSLAHYSNCPKEDLLGKTLVEKYPGIEHSELFKVLNRCMQERTAKQMETEFIFPDGSKADFELSIQPVPEGIFILSIDITKRKIAEEKLLKVNRLYKFISNINKSIVHLTNEQELINNACRIASEIGQFKLAYIAMCDENNILNIISLSGDKTAANSLLRSGLDHNDPALKNLPTVKVLKSGTHHFNNDMQNDPALESWKEELVLHEIHSSISLPIFKFGKVIGIFGFHSTIKNFFDIEEIALLEEAAGDISFALENFERTKKHEETEELVLKNEKRFRGLIEKSSDMKTITSKEGKLTYTSPSVLKSFGFSEEELIGNEAMKFFHPEDIPELIKKRNEILDKPGGSYFFTFRVLHKNGDGIWCEGTVTNLLHEPAIQGMVSNFRNVTEKRLVEAQREFDKNNLNALIGSTHDLMWSIDRDFNVISFNKPFLESIKRATGIIIEKGLNLITADFEDKIIHLYKKFYERALSGETFTEIINNTTGESAWSEVSFYPIYSGQEVIGTACFSRNITERKKQEEQLAKNTREKEIFIKELSQNNKDLQQFAYITSHNLRGPIASLLGLSNLLDGFQIKDPTLVQILAGIKKASYNFDETIRDLNSILTVKDNLTITTEPLFFKASFLKTLEQCHAMILETNAEIIYDFEQSPEINFNKSYLESIFLNLVTNALKYRNKTRRLKINVFTETLDNTVVLKFSDNGIGIDVSLHREKIFKLYQRFNTQSEGKGLGLFLIKSQLEGLGGSIMLESEINEGTRFTLKFRKT